MIQLKAKSILNNLKVKINIARQCDLKSYGRIVGKKIMKKKNKRKITYKQDIDFEIVIKMYNVIL